MTTLQAFRERLWPALWVWLSAAGFASSFGLIFVRIGTGPAVAATAVTGLAAIAFLIATTPTVAVSDGVLTAGRAQIPTELLGSATVLDAGAMRHERGVGLDARAYLLIRGWVPTGIKVEVLDPDDPTPYWLVSSRRPEALAAAVEAGRRTRA